MARGSFPLLEFTKNWENATDFPTVETSEAQVRADMQCLYDEIRDYLNGPLRLWLTAGPDHWFGSQAEYDALVDAGQVDSTTIYFIEETE